ncbi:OsmC family peroxiredoxin [Microbacterium caowuchunii]|uniref:OsmC family protein n=1 Tax=Microbacterium caowuchunii TaxID=2614638 RepID=UPI001244D4CB|nr:OsmC family protein [Microbacterium caowuchunii]QEW00161.1 OsmC family peroxiredoxin [Microbacterium caowuchunii]
MTTHTYESALKWRGRTRDYEGYERRHDVTIAGTELAVSADAAFRGDAVLPNPEQLIVAAASSCQLLSFLAVAALGGVDVVEYRDRAYGEMPASGDPMHLTRIVLRPHIAIVGASVARVERLVGIAHAQCYVANSLITEVVVEPSVEVR